MSENSKIEWTDHTFNPWEGCTKVSPGCAHCYAETRNKRFNAGKNWGKGAPRKRRPKSYWNHAHKWNQTAICSKCGAECFRPDQCTLPSIAFQSVCCDAPTRSPRVFPSLCDWLDDEVPIGWLADFLQLIHDTPNLDWLLLTKRPENLVVGYFENFMKTKLIVTALVAFGMVAIARGNDCTDARGEFLHTGPCLDGSSWRRWCAEVKQIAQSEHHCAWPEEGGREGFFWPCFKAGSSPKEAWENFKQNLGHTYTIDCDAGLTPIENWLWQEGHLSRIKERP